MDVVRLAIVYDTNQAANRLNSLNRQLTGVNGNTRKVASAAVGLAQAMSTGQVSATALTNRLATLGGKAGTIGVIIAVVAGAFLLFRRNADKAREASQKFADQLRDTRRRVDELLRSDIRSPLQGEIERITDAITDLDRVLARQRMNILQRLFGGLSLKEGLQNIKRFLVGGEDPNTRRAREAQAGERERLTPSNLAGSISLQSAAQSNRINAFSALTRGLRSDATAEQVKLLETQLEKLLEVLPSTSMEVQATAASLRDYTEALRRQQRAERLVESGLQNMADALEDFVVTGTVAFTDFLNNILKLLYRDFSGELIHGIVRSAFGGSPSNAGGDAAKDTAGALKGATPSVQSNVNFSIQTMDAQGVAQWLNQNGPQIAAVVGNQAARARGLRKQMGGR